MTNDRAVGSEGSVAVANSDALTTITERSSLRHHRLVFTHAFSAALRSQFERGRFVPVADTRGSIEELTRTTNRHVIRFRHEDQAFVLKQENFRATRVRYGGPFSGPNSEREFRNLRTLRAHGVPAVEPLCYGVSGIGPFVEWSFLLTRDFTGATDLRDWNRKPDVHAISAAQLQDRLLGFAVDLARLHRSRHFVWTMYAKNFLVRPGATGDVELALCDVPRMVHWPTRRLPVSFAVRDLSAFDKWGAAAFPLEARTGFLETYLEALGEGPPLAEWCRRIEHRVNRLNHRTSVSFVRKRMQRAMRSLARGRRASDAHDEASRH